MTEQQLLNQARLLTRVSINGGAEEYLKLRRRQTFDRLKQDCRNTLRYEMVELFHLGRYNETLTREAEYILENIHLFSLKQLVLIAHHWRRESNRRFDNMMRLLWGKKYTGIHCIKFSPPTSETIQGKGEYPPPSTPNGSGSSGTGERGEGK